MVFRLLALGLALASVAASDPVNFARVFKAGEVHNYSMTWDLDVMALSLKEGIKTTVTKISPDGKTTFVRFESTSHTASQGSAGPVPETLVGKVTSHNLPEGLSMDGNNYLFVMLSLFGYTPDKAVSVGDESAIDYKSVWKEKSEQETFHGKSKIVSFDSAKGTVTSKLSIEMNVSGQSAGTMEMTSVSDLKSGALKTCEGVWDIKVAKYKMKIAEVEPKAHS